MIQIEATKQELLLLIKRLLHGTEENMLALCGKSLAFRGTQRPARAV